MTNATDGDLTAFQTDMLVQEGVVKRPQYTTPLNVTATGTPDKDSNVAAGIAYIPNSTSSPTQYFQILVDATESQTHDDTTANPRIDAVVLFLDLGAAPDANASNVASVEIVKGAEAGSPTAPSDGDITTDLGADTWIRLADIEIANPFVSITSGDITDQRQYAYMAGSKIAGENNANSYGHLLSTGVLGFYQKLDSNGNVLIYDDDGTVVEILVPTTGDANAAVNSIGAGGIITMLRGAHTIATAIDIDQGNDVWLRGQGKGTKLTIGSGISGILMAGDRQVVSDMEIDMDDVAAYGIQVEDGSTQCEIRNVRIVNVGQDDDAICVGEGSSAGSAIITGCHINGNDNSGSNGIRLDNTIGSIVNSNFVQDCANDINCTANSEDCIVIGNVVDVAVVDNGSSNTVSPNEVI